MNQCQRRINVVAALGLAVALFGGACNGGDEAVRILRLEPRAGHLTGEQPVNIGGKNFRTDVGYTVYFGTQPASRVMVQSTEQIVAIAPGVSDPGAVDITIRGDDGTAVRIKDGYTYENMGGNVVQQLGDTKQGGSGNLAY